MHNSECCKAYVCDLIAHFPSQFVLKQRIIQLAANLYVKVWKSFVFVKRFLSALTYVRISAFRRSKVVEKIHLAQYSQSHCSFFL